MNTSCAIVISHYNTLCFLHVTIRQLRKYRREDIEQKIYIIDQSNESVYEELIRSYGKSDDIVIVRTAPLYSGYGLDFLFRNYDVREKYIAQYHSDCFPISFNHLSLCISLIEEYNLAFCGQLQFFSDGTPNIYPPSPMFAMAQCFNVGRTDVYKQMSFKAGFCRYHNRPYVEEGISWENNDWDMWAKPLYKERGSDDDVVAFSWEDKYRNDNKLGLAVTGFIEPSYGRLIENLVFHFGSANEARGVMPTMPPLYQDYTRRINENYSDELIEEMVALAKSNQPPETQILSRNYWNGTTKEVSPPSEEIIKRIEELKKS